MTKKPPEQIWLQWYGEDDGNDIGFDRPEGPTFNTEKVYQSDVCYIRAGKPSPIIGNLQIELRAARFAAEAAERRAAELETQLAALRAAGEQEKKYELGRLALLAGVVANDEVSAHEMSEQIAQAIITLRAQLAGEWRPVSEAPPQE